MLASASALIKAFVGNDNESCEDLDVDEPPETQAGSRQQGLNQRQQNEHKHQEMKLSPPDSEGYTKEKLLQPDATKKESLLTRALQRSPERSSFELSPSEQSTTQPHIRIGITTPPSTISTLSSTEDLTHRGMDISATSKTAAQPQNPSRPSTSTNDVALSGQENDEHEKKVEASLGRKRCITFACGGANASAPANPKEDKVTPGNPAQETQNKGQQTSEAPPRKTCISFAVSPHPEKPRTPSPNAITPPPTPFSSQTRLAPPTCPSRTIDQNSLRKPGNPSLTLRTEKGNEVSLAPEKMNSAVDAKANPAKDSEKPRAPRISGLGDFKPSEVTQFHEFDPSSGEEDWVNDSTQYLTKLTLKDCMGKENQIRELGEEVDKELHDEEDEDDDDDDDDDDDEDEDDDEKDDSDEDEEDVVDSDGNESDIESGLEESDGDSQVENASLWTRSSTATTASSYERLKTPPELEKPRTRAHRPASTKSHRSGMLALPDSTDFICGTFDEDRPMEVAYKSFIQQNRRSKHPQLPQDIDPSFPTTDPEDDDEEVDETEAEQFDSNMAKIQRWFDQYDVKRARSPNGSSVSNRSERNTSCCQTTHLPPPEQSQSQQHTDTHTHTHTLPPPAAGGANEGKTTSNGGRTNPHARPRSPGLQHRYRSPPPPPSRGRRGHTGRGK